MNVFRKRCLHRILLERCDRMTKEVSAFGEENLCFVQQACARYCAHHPAHFVTEISLCGREATVILYPERWRIMGDEEWELLKKIEKHVSHISWQGARKVVMTVKFFI